MPIQLRRVPLSDGDQGGLRAVDMPRLNPATVGAAAGALAAGAAKVGDALESLARAEDEKRGVEERSAAHRLAGYAQKEFEKRLSVLNQAPDHTTYALAVDKALADVTSEFASRAGGNERVMRLYSDIMAKYGLERYAQARRVEDKLFEQHHTGVLAETLVRKKHEIVETMRTLGPTAALQQIDEGSSVIDGYKSLLGQGAVTKNKEAWVQSTANVLAYQAAHLDPDAFIDKPGRRGLVALFEGKAEDKFLATLTENAKGRAERLLNDARTRARQQMEDKHKEEIEIFEARTDSMARDGSLSEAWLQDGLSLRLITYEKVKHFRDMMEQRSVQGGRLGNPSTVQRLTQETYAVRPENARTLLNTVGATSLEQLPLDKKMPLMAHLQSMANAYDKMTRDEGKSDAIRQHSEAKEAFNRALTISGPGAMLLESVEIETKRAAFEMLDRNFALGFPEEPMQLYFSRRHEFMARLGVASEKAISEAHRVLRVAGYSDPNNPATRRAEFWLKLVQNRFPNERAKNEEIRQLKELEDLELWHRRFSDAAPTDRPKPAPAKGAPATGPIPPVSSPRK